MMDVVRLGLAGFGTVGSGLARILRDNADWIARRVGKRIVVAKVLVRDATKTRDASLVPEATFTTDPAELLGDPSLDIVCELMGGLDAAEQLIRQALSAGKHVVTANKALLAERGQPLFALAAEKGLGLAYEASVCGGIPIVQALKTSLAPNRIEKLVGILNGTCNYILSEMTTSGLDFDSALEQAKVLGYAEADPTLDIDGVDAAHKLAVLIRLAYGAHYPFEQLPVRGIREVQGLDIGFAYDFGYRIKLIGQVRDVDGRLEAGVFPALIKHTYLMARAGGNLNAVRLEGNAVGPVMLTGQGAGDMPTGSAVVSDVMEIVRSCGTPDNTGFKGDEDRPLPTADILPPEEATSRYYFRFTVADRPGVMAALAKALGDNGISIAQAVQKGDEAATSVPIVFLTHAAPARAVQIALEAIDAMDFTRLPTVHYRIL